MSKFTDGPWSYDGSHIYAPDGEIIAQVHNPGRVASDYPLEANRNLIAAAPELFEALRAYDCWNYEVQSASVNGESVYSYADFQHMRKDAAKKASVALAKALGEQP